MGGLDNPPCLRTRKGAGQGDQLPSLEGMQIYWLARALNGGLKREPSPHPKVPGMRAEGAPRNAHSSLSFGLSFQLQEERGYFGAIKKRDFPPYCKINRVAGRRWAWMSLPTTTTSALLLLSGDTRACTRTHPHTLPGPQAISLPRLLPIRWNFLKGDILQRQTQTALGGSALSITKVCKRQTETMHEKHQERGEKKKGREDQDPLVCKSEACYRSHLNPHMLFITVRITGLAWTLATHQVRF